jgi:hypothetical protein
MSLASHIGSGHPSFHSPVGKSGILAKRARAPRFAAPAIKEFSGAALALAFWTAILIALAALDLWVWTPGLHH